MTMAGSVVVTAVISVARELVLTTVKVLALEEVPTRTVPKSVSSSGRVMKRVLTPLPVRAISKSAGRVSRSGPGPGSQPMVRVAVNSPRVAGVNETVMSSASPVGMLRGSGEAARSGATMS